MSFHCKVLTPERVAFDGNVESAVLPAFDGEIGILPGHADFLGELGVGEARLSLDKGNQVFLLNRGYLRVSKGQLTVLAEEAETGLPQDQQAAWLQTRRNAQA